MLVHKGESMAILSNNGTEFKNKVLNKVCDQLGIKRLFSSPFHPHGNAKVKYFLKRTVTKFFDSSDLEWDKPLPFACHCINIFPSSRGAKYPFFLMFGCDPAEGHLSHLINNNRYYGTNEGKIILEKLHNHGSITQNI